MRKKILFKEYPHRLILPMLTFPLRNYFTKLILENNLEPISFKMSQETCRYTNNFLCINLEEPLKYVWLKLNYNCWNKYVMFCINASLLCSNYRVPTYLWSLPAVEKLWLPRGACSRLCITGSRKAAVLPLPVCAQASTSRPASTIGTTCFCTGVSLR